MKTVEVTDNNFDDVMKKSDIVFLDFWASWCGPCRMFGPIYEKMAAKYPDIIFGKVNTETEQHLAAAFQVRSIPTVMAFRENVMLFSQPGLVSEEVLDDLISQIKALDMDKVKADLESSTKEA